jgi:formylglycine-generating enzyme required for sulfatase activity
MVGNVWEWTKSLHEEYPYNVSDGREDEKTSGVRVIRGGSFSEFDNILHCSIRISSPPDLMNSNIGFRIALTPKPPK